MRLRVIDPPAPAGPVLYLIAAVAMFVPRLVAHSDQLLGVGTDPDIFVWALGWLPHALSHGLNPLFASNIYYPQGFDLAHATIVPVPALLLAPVTALAGPITAYNVGMVLSPTLTATFSFLLCRRLTRCFWASLVAGWLFGFSPYVLGQMAGHLNLTLLCMVPAIVQLALQAGAREVSRERSVVLLTLALTVQFCISDEVLASFTLFGAVVLAAAYVLGDGAERGKLRYLLRTLLYAYLATAVLCSWYIFQALRDGQVPVLPGRSDILSADLLSYFVPTALTQIGGSTFLTVTSRFTEGPFEGGAYMTLPLIVMAALAARRRWSSLGVRAASIALIVIVICSFGGHLHIVGAITMPMPWALVNDLPVIGLLLPARFAAFALLIVVVLAAMWIAATRRRVIATILAALAVALAWPIMSNTPWDSTAPVSTLFASSAYRASIRPSDVVLVLPMGGGGPSMLWHAQAAYSFTLVGGSLLPPEGHTPYTSDPAYPFLVGAPAVQAGGVIAVFLARYRVTLILMQPGAPTTAPWEALLTRLGWRATVRGGVVLMRRA